MRSELNKTAETLLQVINNYGCITTAQATALCDDDEDKAQRNLSHLILLHCIHETNGFYVPVKDPKPESNTVDALWVAFDKAKDEDGVINKETLLMSFPNNPVNVCLIQADKFYNIVTLSEINITSTLPFLMEKFTKNYKTAENAGNQEYIFVVRSMEIVRRIAEFAPNMPNKIAMLEGDIKGKVTIRYMSPKK